MKKLILILGVLFIAILAGGQTKPTEAASDSYITKPVYQYVLGTTSDTITNATGKSHVIRIKGAKSMDFNIQLYSDWISGTAGGTLILLHSIDGVTYTSVVGDTITIAGVTADALDAEVINKVNFLYPYMKLTYAQTGTAVTVPRIYIYAKE